MTNDGDYTITIFPTEVLGVSGDPELRWHWKRLNDNGGQVDGSGGQRNGLATKKATKELVRERYPDDKIVG